MELMAPFALDWTGLDWTPSATVLRGTFFLTGSTIVASYMMSHLSQSMITTL